MVKQQNASRFSTLKVFNFAGSSSSNSNPKSQQNTGDSSSGPPPPPPKDRYYLYNKSMSSLVPDSSASGLSTPLTPGFKSGPSHSTVDLPGEFGAVSLAAPGPSGLRSVSGSSAEGSVTGSGSTRAMKGFFGKIASKSKRAPRAAGAAKSPLVSDDAQSQTQSDDGISLPWNFQHNIHVDEGYTGLPPSWSTSLMEAGFSEDEIAAIQARRMNASAANPYLYTDRPDSPSTRATPLLANPQTRTTSLPRQFSDTASTTSSLYRPSTAATTATICTTSTTTTSPRLPPLQPALVPRPTRKPSARSQYSYSDADDASFDAGHPDAQYVYVNSRAELPSHAPSDSNSSRPPSSARSFASQPQSQNHSPAPLTPTANTSMTPIVLTPVSMANGERPRTPPRRTFRVINESPGSPPPAYHAPAADSAFARLVAQGEKVGIGGLLEAKGGAGAGDEAVVDDEGEREEDRQKEGEGEGEGEDEGKEEEEEVDMSQVASTSSTRRLTALPPRLSLHETSGDLSSWSASLFSAIPSASGSSSSSLLTPAASSSKLPAPPVSTSKHIHPHPSHPQPTTASTKTMPPTRPIPTAPTLTKTTITAPTRRLPPQKPVPLPPLGEEAPAQVLLLPDTPISAHGTSQNGHGHGPSTPLYNEIMDMVQRGSPAGTPRALPPREEDPGAFRGVDEREGGVQERAGEDGNGSRNGNGDEGEGDEGYLSAGRARRDSNRDSDMSAVTVTGATIVRGASLATRAVANVISPNKGRGAARRESQREEAKREHEAEGQEEAVQEEEDEDEMEEEDEDDDEEEELVFPPTPSAIQSTFLTEDTTGLPSRHYKSASTVSGAPSTSTSTSTPSLTPPPAPGSPHSSFFSESSSSGSDSESGSSAGAGLLKQPHPQSKEYVRMSTFSDQASLRETFGAQGVDPDITLKTGPSIVINGVHIDDTMNDAAVETPGTPARQYRGWQSAVVAPLAEFIDDTADPRVHFAELQEIAEAESGSVYAARVLSAATLGLPPDVAFVAIKSVPILPSGSPKLLDLQKELRLMHGVVHKNILTMDMLYVDLVEDSLWIRMELMERSLADVVGLVEEGLMVQERMIARFASDVLHALEYLQKQHIAHRDVRSDNLLLNKNGVLKIADFSNAVQVTSETPECSGAAGVIYWQAPEMRSGGTYNALKVDVWSLGATVWETAQSEPPFTEIHDPRQFGDRWPSLTHPEIYSRSFHEFLRLCSEPSATRPDPSDLLNTPFIRNACGRAVNVQLLSQCRAIEETMLERENDDP